MNWKITNKCGSGAAAHTLYIQGIKTSTVKLHCYRKKTHTHTHPSWHVLFYLCWYLTNISQGKDENHRIRIRISYIWLLKSHTICDEIKNGSTTVSNQLKEFSLHQHPRKCYPFPDPFGSTCFDHLWHVFQQGFPRQIPQNPGESPNSPPEFEA